METRQAIGEAVAGSSQAPPPRALGLRARPSQQVYQPPVACKISVSGYPQYTQPQDLTRVFSKFGTVKVDKLSAKLASLTFSNEEEAKEAIAATEKVNIYGEFLIVKPYNHNEFTETTKQPVTPKRDFTRSKQQKGVIIEPKQIDLSGDFYQQLDRILAAVRLTQDDATALSQLYLDLEGALRTQWPGCSAIPFGSVTTGLGIKTSDADCFINVPVQFRNANPNFVNKAKRVLQQYPQIFAEILSIPRANTPIVKFFHIPTETNCDVSFKTPLGAQNSKLIAFLLHSDPRLIPVAVFIKYWAKIHEFSGSGKLTNYALTMLFVFYLQQPPMSILPSVEWLQRDSNNDVIVDYWNTGFMCHRNLLPPSSNTSSISELLGGFFEYYSRFNFEEMVVCPFLGFPIKKHMFKDLNMLPNEFQRYKDNIVNKHSLPLRFTSAMCVQDPFEQCHNVASAIPSKLTAEIKAYFDFAANAYEKEKLNKCRDFFKVILLQKPKIVRGKTHPEFRVNLFPRIIVNIINPDWKSVVRDLVNTIFEKILKIKLGKVEEKVNPDSKKVKEKYMGVVTKPVWKRKQFSKLYNIMNLTFQDKQEKITEEILLVEKEKINIEFQMTITFCHDPKSSVIAIRMSSGDIDTFREFGKFFITVTQNWFMELMKPFSKPVEKDTAAKIAETIKVLDSNLKSNHVEDSDDDDDDYADVSTQSDAGEKCDVSEFTNQTANIEQGNINPVH